MDGLISSEVLHCVQHLNISILLVRVLNKTQSNKCIGLGMNGLRCVACVARATVAVSIASCKDIDGW